MSLRQIEAATVFPVGLPLVKAQCRISADDEDEQALLEHYIATANEKIGAMCGLVLGAEVWEFTVSNPRGPIALPLTPVSALNSINGSEDAGGYTLSIDGDQAMVQGDWPSGDVVIRFTAGGSAPPAVKQAMLFLIAHWFQNREAVSEGELKEVPFAVESMVSEHRRGWVRA